MKPLILTPGEPGSIASEITAKAWKAMHGESASAFCLIADEEHFSTTATKAGLDIPTRRVASMAEAGAVFSKALPILHQPLGAAVALGRFAVETAAFVTGAIETAVDLCLAGQAAALVTNPIQKEALYAAGFAFQGHTDFLGALARNRGHKAQDVMMLVAPGLRAIPVTVHIALKDVPGALSIEAIVSQARIAATAMRRHFGIASPRIAITGLNPHAGENGSMGREDIDIIQPAIATLRQEGLTVLGPMPADTAFHAEARETYDVILCMYHDQALIPVKTIDFHGGVNVTLGLPFIRTSPDHGTALGIAGTGTARADSLIAAIKLARQMVTATAP